MELYWGELWLCVSVKSPIPVYKRDTQESKVNAYTAKMAVLITVQKNSYVPVKLGSSQHALVEQK